ncbi:hypothetical protein WJX72_003919 [[Myrmecia] bisecta]|uniref:Heme-binding protein 2 n=1 Tax=[Myrmecia] bisecta TaxID=41462 RepID=A0AAW1PU75_9CHLO
MRTAVAFLLLCIVVGAPIRANFLDRFASRFLGTAEQPADDDKPWFCHDEDCPPFTVVKKLGDTSEVRKYPQRCNSVSVCALGPTLQRKFNHMWTTRLFTCIKFELALAKGYASLYRYFDGGNDQSKKLPATEPVVARIVPVNGFRGSEQNYTIAYYLPTEFQKQDPPKPTNEAIQIFTIPAATVYAAQFGGFATEGSILETAAKLLEQIKGEKVAVHEDFFYFAAYDPPTRMTNRHNEVWFVPKDPGTDALVRA